MIYRKKIFLYTFILLAIFTTGVVIVEQNREKRYKTSGLESVLNGYAELLHKYIEKNGLTENNIDSLQKIMPLLPENIRITIIANDGTVTFDNDFPNPAMLENHKDRPEIVKAAAKPYGTNIRKSTSLYAEFLYYAIHYDTYFVRVALPYDLQVKNFLKSDNVFLYIIIILFIMLTIAVNYVLNRFEREKLLQHFHHSGEGLCFFTENRKKIYANAHFIQLLNVIIDTPTLNPECIFEESIFKGIQDYLAGPDKEPLFTTKLSRNGKHFDIHVFIFKDKSFEVIINDISKSEKTRLLKQEMTNNIAHELRTPVTSIRGFLETLLYQKNDIDEEKRNFFLERAHAQSIRLSELIQDISLITKTEEAPDQFKKENISIRPLLDELKFDLELTLSQHNIRINMNVPDDVTIKGNRTLLYSVFRNLIDNSIRYGGDHIDIHINNYTENEEYYYFSYYDTGNGVSEIHLNRIFERFYRVNEGRTRNSGGSGLGLSIVKNAILFHKGEIVAKNRVEGGLEFLFTLKK